VPENTRGHASEENSGQTGAPERSHRNEIGVSTPSDAQNQRPRIVVLDDELPRSSTGANRHRSSDPERLRAQSSSIGWSAKRVDRDRSTVQRDDASAELGGAQAVRRKVVPGDQASVRRARRGCDD
jgi:hypothetical protein